MHAHVNPGAHVRGFLLNPHHGYAAGIAGKARLQQLKGEGIKLLEPDDGDILAPLKVAVFTDPECNFCEKLHKEMKQVLQERRDIVFYVLLYPLSFHKDAYWKSKSILCNQSLKMLDEAFARKEIPRLECETKEIDANIRLAEALGITGTPTLVLPDGRVHSGTLPAKQLIAFIQGSR